MRRGQMPLLWVLLAALALLCPGLARAADAEAVLDLQAAPDLAAYALLPALVLVLACGSAGPARLLSTPVAVWLGEVSYAVYLLHIFLLHPLDQARAACRLALPPHLADALAFCLIATFLLAAAEVAHRLVERPARAWLQASPSRVREP